MVDVPVQLTVNGQARSATVEPRLTLADFLREQCHLTGTHLGCEHGVCGACTVLIDGDAVRACLVFAVQATGTDVTTIEGIGSPDGDLSPVQSAFRDCHGLQCGFCTPGFVVSVTAFLRDNPEPTDQEIREGLSGNLCRCTGYQSILQAVRQAADAQRADSQARTAGPMTASTSPGAARYVGDARQPGRGRAAAHRPRHLRRRRLAARDVARVLRAQRLPRAAIRGIDTAAAREQPGVRFVFTAADLNPGVKEQWHTSIGRASPETPRPPLAEDEVRFVGDPVALVVAETRALAEDAAELVEVDYEPLPAVVDYTQAETAGELVHEQHGSNVVGELSGLPASALEDAFASAAHVASETISPAGVRAGADGGPRPRGRLRARVGRSDDLRGDAVAARGSPVLLAPARYAGAPHPRRDARHRRRRSGRR